MIEAVPIRAGRDRRGGLVCAELASYGPAGTATRFKRVAGERLSRPELSPMDVANDTLLRSIENQPG